MRPLSGRQRLDLVGEDLVHVVPEGLTVLAYDVGLVLLEQKRLDLGQAVAHHDEEQVVDHGQRGNDRQNGRATSLDRLPHRQPRLTQ